MIDPNDSPNVLAYRVGQLEKIVAEGFAKVDGNFATMHAKLDMLKDGFVSHEQLAEAVKQGQIVHSDHERRIASLEGVQIWLIKIIIGAVLLAVLASIGLKAGII